MSHKNLHVRTATPADVDILLSLISSAYRGDESRKGWTTEADLLTGDRIDKAGLLAKIAEPNGVMLLATDASSSALVACYELLKRNADVGFFGLFAVEPRRQGCGLGRQILQVAENYAREVSGVKKMELRVIGARTELIAWYLRRGYRKTGEKQPFPYEHLVGGAAALRDDLYFEVLEKDLVVNKEQSSGA